MQKIKKIKTKIVEFLFRNSLEQAAKEQGLVELKERLKKIVPDIAYQYSLFKIDTADLENKVRNLHAFQIALVIETVAEFDKPTIIDIGDSSGTHSQYILGLYGAEKKIKCISVNLDHNAIEKIKAKGLEAIHERAERLPEHNIRADICLCFEILEHLSDPCQFLHDLSLNADVKYVVFTVPYLKRSRVALHHIREARKEAACAENTHIFELSPEDWKLLSRHAGWKILKERIYLQYPKKSMFYFTKPLWRKFDYEGFYGLVLVKDDYFSSRYKDW